MGRFAVSTLSNPFLTCEAVLIEAFLAKREHIGPASIFNLLDSDFLTVDFSVAVECHALAALTTKYCDLPIALADACLVRMAELRSRGKVLTLEAPFRA